MKPFYIIFLTICCSTFGFNTSAQEDSTKVDLAKVIVVKNDGAVYIGVILFDDDREILINTDEVGRLYIPKHFIKSIKPYDPNTIKETETITLPTKDTIVTADEIPNSIPPPTILVEVPEDSAWQNYVSTKYIIHDNAMPLRKGEAFLKIMPIGVEAQIPLTKNWSIGAISTYWGFPVAFKTKYSIELNPKNYLSFDLLYGTMAFASFTGRGIKDGGGMASVSYTFGDRRKNFSFKLGYSLVHEETQNWVCDQFGCFPQPTTFYTYNHGVFAFGGMLPVSKNASFILDATVAIGEVEIIGSAAAAVRFGRKPRHQWQFGGSLWMSDGFFFPVPVPHLSYTYVFGERNP